MSNVLLTADYHIHDYRAHNLFDDPKFRLNQFTKLTDRLIEIAVENQCKAVIIAGDVLHVASPRPYVVNFARAEIGRLASVVPVYMTNGQHEYDSRTNMTGEHTLLQVFNDIPNVHYIQEGREVIGGATFQFCGWTPDQDLSHIQPADVLIGHATVLNAKITQGNTIITHGQDFDASKFKLCVMGDIHRHQQLGNILIPGVPIQHSFGDHHDVGVCILDTNTLEWTRVPTIVKGKWDFLQLITTNDPQGDDEYVVTKPLPTSDGKTVGDVHKSLDIHEIIEKCIEDSGLRGVHTEVLQRYQVNTDKSIDMKFFLVNMKIQNYQSIDLLEFSFQDGITVINGLNGTGKSTLVNAIRACLTGEWSPRDDMTINESFVELDLTLNYQGINYRIVRGWENNGYLNFYIGDLENKIETENQTATKERIIQSLPFTKPEYMKLMFHDQTRPKFLSSYNYAGRVDLVTNLLGLHVVEDYQAIATDLRRAPAEEIKRLGIEKGGLTVFVQSAVVGDTSLGQIDEYVEQLGVYKDLFNKIKAISSEKSKIAQIVSEITLNNNMITKSTYDPRDALLEIPNVDNLKAEKVVIEQDLLQVNNEIGQVSNELSQARNAVVNAERDITAAKNKLSTLVVGNCYTCSSPLNEEKVIDLRKTLDDDVSKHSSTVVLINMSVETLNTKLASLEDKRNKLASRKDELVSEIANSDSIRLRKDNAVKMQNQVKFLEDNNNALNLRKLEHESTITIALNAIPDEFKVDGQLTISESSVQEKISSFESKIHTINAMKELADKVNRAKSDIEKLDQSIAEHQAIVDNYDSYIKLMSPKGVVIHSVLSKISELWTNDQYLIKAYKTKVNGDTVPDFSMSYFNGKFWVSYEKCSGGQKVVCDLYLLNCLISLIGGVGFLIFDETFKEADHPNLTNIVELLKDTQSNSTMIISHELNFPYNDHLITTSFENGLTSYNLVS